MTLEISSALAEAPVIQQKIAISDFTKYGKLLSEYEKNLVDAIADRSDGKINKLLNDDLFPSLKIICPRKTLATAVLARNYTVLNTLVDSWNINAIDPDTGSTVIFIAANRGDLKMMKYLLGKGSDAFRIDQSYYTALDWSLKKSNDECATAILDQVKNKNMLAQYGKWESNLSELRTAFAKSDSYTVKNENALLQEIKKVLVKVDGG